MHNLFKNRARCWETWKLHLIDIDFRFSSFLGLTLTLTYMLISHIKYVILYYLNHFPVLCLCFMLIAYFGHIVWNFSLYAFLIQCFCDDEYVSVCIMAILQFRRSPSIFERRPFVLQSNSPQFGPIQERAYFSSRPFSLYKDGGWHPFRHSTNCDARLRLVPCVIYYAPFIFLTFLFRYFAFEIVLHVILSSNWLLWWPSILTSKHTICQENLNSSPLDGVNSWNWFFYRKKANLYFRTIKK